MLAGVLGEFEHELRARGIYVEEDLLPGVPASLTEAELEAVGLGMSEELADWYAWHNGPRDGMWRSRIPFVTPASVQWCAAQYTYSLEKMVPGGLWKENWLQLEWIEGLAILCPPASEPGRVRRSDTEDHDFADATEANDLAEVVSAWLVALRTGAATWSPEKASWTYDQGRLWSIGDGRVAFS